MGGGGGGGPGEGFAQPIRAARDSSTGLAYSSGAPSERRPGRFQQPEPRVGGITRSPICFPSIMAAQTDHSFHTQVTNNKSINKSNENKEEDDEDEKWKRMGKNDGHQFDGWALIRLFIFE